MSKDQIIASKDLLKPNKDFLNNVCAAKTFEELPEVIQQKMKTKEDFESLLKQYPRLSKEINIKILVNKAIELNTINAATTLIIKNDFLKKLQKNQEAYENLLNHFINNLQWIHTVSSELSLSNLKKLLGVTHPLVLTIKEFKAKANDQVSESPSDIINNLFKVTNPCAQANLAYFIANPKPCSRCLRQTLLGDMFNLADTKQVLFLCWALIKNRVNLLKHFFTTTLRGNQALKQKIEGSLIQHNSSKEATDFINYKPSVTGELFKNPANTIDLITFTNYLLHAHNPRQILKAHGDLIAKHSAQFSKVKAIKKVEEVHTLLKAEGFIGDFATNFHLLVKFKPNLLKQALAQPETKKAVLDKLTEDGSHKEWVVMHLKENPHLVKELCKGNSDNFLKLLTLTDNPGEFLRKLAGKIDSKDRARIIFQAVIQIARYTHDHPDYLPEFQKILTERFWLDFGYRKVKSIAIKFLSDELRGPQRTWLGSNDSEDSLKFLIADDNLRPLFNLTKQQHQQLAKVYFTQPSSHKALARYGYSILDLEHETPKNAQYIRDKSIYYALESLDPTFRQMALNQAIYGVAEEDKVPATNTLITLAKANLFDEPIEILKALDREEVENFLKFYCQQISKIDTLTKLDELKARFPENPPLIDLLSPILEKEASIKKATYQKQLKKLVKQPLADSGLALYQYAKEHGIEDLLNLNPGIDAQVIKLKVAYGAILEGDQDFVENFTATFLFLMKERDFQEKADKQIATALLKNIGDKDFIKNVIQSLDTSLSHPEIDKVLSESDELILGCIQLNGEWEPEHFNKMLSWFDKNNLTQAKQVAEQLLISKASLLALMKTAQINSVLKDSVLASQMVLDRFKTLPLTEEEAEVFEDWYYHKSEVKQVFQVIFPDFIFLNKANHKLTNGLIGNLSEGKRFALLKDLNVDANFIAQNPSLIRYEKLHTQDQVKKELAKNHVLLSHILSILDKLPPSVVEFFRKDQGTLFLTVLNQKNLLSKLSHEARAAFDNALIAEFSEEVFVRALLKDENKQAAIAIVTSHSEELRAAFWLAAEKTPKLVAQVIEAILDNPTEINKYKDVINKYLHSFSSDKTAISVRHHNNILAITEKTRTTSIPQVHSMSAVNSEFNKVEPKLRTEGKTRSKVSEQVQKAQPVAEESKQNLSVITLSVSDFHYIEDIYKFLSDHRNQWELVSEVFKSLKVSNPALLDAAWNRTHVVDITLKILLEKINDSLPLAMPKVSVVEPKRNTQVNSKKIKKELTAEGQDKEYNKNKKAGEEITEGIRSKIRKIKVGTIVKETTKIKSLKNIEGKFRDLEEKAKHNLKDTTSHFRQSTTVLAHYQAIKCQYLLLEQLRENKFLDIKRDRKDKTSKEDHLNSIAKQYHLDSPIKLNEGLANILKYAEDYFNHGKYHLAVNYYQEVIEACKEEDAIDPNIRYVATSALISLLIQEPSTEIKSQASSDKYIKELFQSFFTDFSNSFIESKISEFPTEWLASRAVYKVIEKNLALNESNAKLVQWVEKNSQVKHQDETLNKNLDELKKIIEVKGFTIRYEEEAGIENQATLLKEIYARDPELLFDDRLNFNLETVIATTNESLDILLFYLSKTKLAEKLLAGEENIQSLYDLGRKNELIKFVLTSCYPHLERYIDKEALAQAIIITQHIDSSQNHEIDAVLDKLIEVGTEGPVTELPPGPPPPPPPGPPPPPPPSGASSKLKIIKKDKAENSPNGSAPLTKKETASERPAFNVNDIVNVKLKKASDQPGITQSKKSDTSGHNIADMIAAQHKKNVNIAWQEITINKEDKQPSVCGQLILASLTMPISGNAIPEDIKRGFTEVYNGIKKLKVEDITPERALNDLQTNVNLKGHIIKDKERLIPLATKLAELARANKPVEKPKIAPPTKPLVVKAQVIKPENQIESSLQSKAINLVSFLGHANQVTKIKESLILAYKKYISMQEKTDQTSEEKFKEELSNMLEENMLATSKEQIEEAHQRSENPGPSLTETLDLRSQILIKQMSELYKVYAPKVQTNVSPAAVFNEIRSRLNPRTSMTSQLERSEKIYDFKINGESVFTKQTIEKVLGKDNQSSLSNFELTLWQSIENLRKGSRVTREVLRGRLHAIAIKRDLDKFTSDFDTLIWNPLKDYATFIGRQNNVIEQLEQSVLATVPQIGTLYSEKVFDKALLSQVILEDRFKQVGDFLADKIYTILSNKPVFRDEIWKVVEPAMTGSDKERDFDILIWKRLENYADARGNRALTQEKDPLKEKRSSIHKHGLFSKQASIDNNVVTINTLN